jgi:hypothetical protein
MQAALDGAGLALVAHHRAAQHLARGEALESGREARRGLRHFEL